MFPWVDGFHWTVGHIVFLSIFFGVVLTILTTVLRAALHTLSDFRAHRVNELCWRASAAELPESERHCRHEFAGRLSFRVCDNAFDCRHCPQYADFAGLPANSPVRNLPVNYSDKLLYHRGHTWVRPEEDGTFTIGLDELARNLIGHPDSVEFPADGSTIESNGIAWRMTKNGHEIRVRAPLDGKVVRTNRAGDDAYLRLRPEGRADLRHLLHGAEVSGWLASECDRLQLQLRTPDAPPTLADGGLLMPDLMDAVPQADWETILESTFLEA